MNLKDDELMLMYSYVIEFDHIKFRLRFPEYIQYEDKIFRIIHAVIGPLDQEYIIKFLVKDTLEFVIKMSNFDYEISDDLLIFIGNQNRDHMIVSSIDCLLNFNNNIYDHVRKLEYFFGLVISRRIEDPLPNDIVLEDEGLEKLSQITRLINSNYKELYDNNFWVIEILILYGYYHNNDYTCLYNYLNDPAYYNDKLVNNDIADDSNYDSVQLNTNLEFVYENLTSLFSLHKTEIK